MLKWEKVEGNRWIEIVKCDRINLDEGEKGSFVRYPGKDDVYFTFATSILNYESLPALEDWYIEGNDIYVKFPDARQHIGKIL
jgi:hypothetical protein